MHKRLRFEKRLTTTVQANYLLYLPAEYEESTNRWPLMLFLHGAGERGSNLSKVSAHGPPKLVKQRKQFPLVIVSPQCPADEIWDDATLLALLDSVCARHRIDTNRIYLTGLSMGGYGAWSLGLRYPERFAAMAPICGGGDVLPILLASRRNSKALRSLGVWAFHGAKDPVVPVSESERMLAALRREGVKNVRLTVYPEAGHDSWTVTYENPKLYEWFLAHRR